MASDSLTIEGIEFTGPHGWYPHERAYGCRFSVDLKLNLNLTLPEQSDTLEDSVDYSSVAARIVEIGQGESHRLLEHLALAIARGILTDFDKIESIDLTLRKLHPPVVGAPRAVALNLFRCRSDFKL